MPDAHADVFFVNAPATQIHLHLAWSDLGSLHQPRRLAELVFERMAIKWVTVKGSAKDHQIVLQGRCDTHLDAKLIRLPALAFVDQNLFEICKKTIVYALYFEILMT